jgi:hypothetical protein
LIGEIKGVTLVKEIGCPAFSAVGCVEPILRWTINKWWVLERGLNTVEVCAAPVIKKRGYFCVGFIGTNFSTYI